MNINDIWSEKYRPKTLDEILLSDDIRAFFENIKKTKASIPNLIFYGGPGGGKSSLARIVVNDILGAEHLIVNASEESGIDVIRNKIQGFIQTKSFVGGQKVVIFEEAESLSYSSSGGRSGSQNALKQVMDDYSQNVRFVFTTNNILGLTEPIVSRCIAFNFVPTKEQILKKCITVLKGENVKVPEGQKEKIIKLVKDFYPDFRKPLNYLQRYSATGELILPEDLGNTDIQEEIFEKLTNKTNLFDIRKYVIECETKFKSDYRELMKGLFELFFNHEMNEDTKKKVLIVLVEGLKDHTYVMDKEINFFGCLIKINQLLCGGQS